MGYRGEEFEEIEEIRDEAEEAEELEDEEIEEEEEETEIKEFVGKNEEEFIPELAAGERSTPVLEDSGAVDDASISREESIEESLENVPSTPVTREGGYEELVRYESGYEAGAGEEYRENVDEGIRGREREELIRSVPILRENEVGEIRERRINLADWRREMDRRRGNVRDGGEAGARDDYVVFRRREVSEEGLPFEQKTRKKRKF